MTKKKLPWPFNKLQAKPKPVPPPRKLQGFVTVQGPASGPYLISSSDQPQVSETRIRGRLESAKLIEASVNPATAVKVGVSTVSGVKYPDDFNDFQDYFDAYNYIPYVARAINIKQFMIWQMGYDLESEDDASKQAITDLLTNLQADTVIRDGALFALVSGNMYWQRREDQSFKPLNPSKMGLKLDSDQQITEYHYEPTFGKVDRIKPNEILHLKFNAEPWALFGVSCLRCVLPTIKALLFMEEKLPWIARRRADPMLHIQIGSKDNIVDKDTYDRVKNGVINRKPGEDIFNDGTIEQIQEVYQSASVGGRQTVEPILNHFTRNLVAGLGVPEPALGFGGTTTMATAEYQERILEAEVRAYQRVLKRFHEANIFSLVQTGKPVKMVWRPMKEEDKTSLSTKLQGEIEHGVVSPSWARKTLGYPDEAGKGTVMSVQLVPSMLSEKLSEERQKRLETYEKLSKVLDKETTAS
jgi:hypothetical protein